MRKQAHILLTACAVALGNGISAWAAETTQLEQRSFLELARMSCSPEIDVLSKIDTSTIDALASQTGGLDPNLRQDIHTAFDKFAVGSFVNAIQIGDIAAYSGALQAGETISEDMYNKSKALLNLVECLWIVEEDRALLDEFMLMGVESGEFPEGTTSDDLLYAVNSSECVRHNEASRRILGIDPNSSDAANQVQAIYEDTYGSCEEAYK